MPRIRQETDVPVTWVAEVYYGPAGWAWGVDAGALGVDGGGCMNAPEGARFACTVLRNLGIVRPGYGPPPASEVTVTVAPDENGRPMWTLTPATRSLTAPVRWPSGAMIEDPTGEIWVM